MKLDRWQDTLKALEDVKNGRFLDADIVAPQGYFFAMLRARMDR